MTGGLTGISFFGATGGLTGTSFFGATGGLTGTSFLGALCAGGGVILGACGWAGGIALLWLLSRFSNLVTRPFWLNDTVHGMTFTLIKARHLPMRNTRYVPVFCKKAFFWPMRRNRLLRGHLLTIVRHILQWSVRMRNKHKNNAFTDRKRGRVCGELLRTVVLSNIWKQIPKGARNQS
jgi:hypothetical protein